jgi:hypothetical protein
VCVIKKIKNIYAQSMKSGAETGTHAILSSAFILINLCTSAVFIHIYSRYMYTFRKGEKGF